MTRESGRPSEHDLRQIVQIAAIQFDEKIGIERAALDVLVKPVYTSVLPPFFTELTNITQDDVDAKGLDLSVALDELRKFSQRYQVYIFDADWGVLKQNSAYIQRPFDFEAHPFIRVKPLLVQWGIRENDYSSGTLYKAAGLTMGGHVHNALHDVRSMAAAMCYFETKQTTS